MTPEPATAEFACPHCGEIIAVPSSGTVEFACPQCGGTFATISDDRAPATPSREEELDALRIRQLSTLRRATYRSRSYAMIAATASVVVAVQAIALLVRQFTSHRIAWSAIVMLLVIAAGGYGGWFFARRAARLH